MILPICRALRMSGWKTTLLALTTASTVACKADEPHIGFQDLAHFADKNADYFGRLIVPEYTVGSPVSREESLAYHGASFADLAARIGIDAAWDKWRELGRQSFLPVDFMHRVLLHFAPDVVIATNSPRTEQATMIAAGRLGIPSLCAVDMFALHEVKWISQPNFAHRITVLNESVRDLMIRHGVAPNKLAITGNPAFDGLNAPQTMASGKALRAARKWDDGLLNILWASQVEPESHPFTGQRGDPKLPRRIEAELRAIVKEDPRIRLIVRYHPSEQVDFVVADRVVFSPSSEPLHALLHAVDLVVVTASTVGLEAWLTRRPVIAVEGSVFTADAPFAAMGISAGVQTTACLKKMVKDLTGKPFTFPLSGQVEPPPSNMTATQAIVAEINKLKLQASE